MSILNPYIDAGFLNVVGPYPRNAQESERFLQVATVDWDAPRAKTRMENLLVGDAANVTLDAVLAPNDPVARAIIEALRADAKYRTNLPVVTGQDAELASLESIAAGDQYATIFKNTARLAEAAAILADQLIQGQTPNIPGAVTAASIGLGQIGDTTQGGQYNGKQVTTYLLDIELITKANINIPVDAGFYDDPDSPNEGARARAAVQRARQ